MTREVLSKEEFIQWKEHFITKQVFEIVKTKIEDAKDLLAYKETSDPDTDQFFRGMIRAFTDVLEISYED